MLDRSDQPGSSAVFAGARTLPAPDSLSLFCRAATGRTGYLVVGNLVIHPENDTSSFVHASLPGKEPELRSASHDPALAGLGLALSAVTGSFAARPRPIVLDRVLVALRLGLLANILDRSFRHLEKRKSFGRKALQHQLIKARFSASGAFVAGLADELDLSERQGRAFGFARAHDDITAHSCAAAKLMGGHGFLAGSNHSLEYLSSLALVAYGKRR